MKFPIINREIELYVSNGLSICRHANVKEIVRKIAAERQGAQCAERVRAFFFILPRTPSISRQSERIQQRCAVLDGCLFVRFDCCCEKQRGNRLIRLGYRSK